MKKVILILMLFIMTGCGNKITKGEVYYKQHNEPYTTTQVIVQCLPCGKSVMCHPVSFIVHHKENYEIRIKSYNRKEKEWEKATYFVSKEDFDKLEIGSKFIYDKDRMKDEEPVKKERNDGK